MKSGHAIRAWLGLALTAVGTLPAFSSSDTWVTTGQLGAGVGYAITVLLGFIGTVIALIGGLNSRPRYFWLGSIVVGALYIASFYGYIVPSPASVPTPNGHHLSLLHFTYNAIPGIVCIVLGLILLVFRRRAVRKA